MICGYCLILWQLQYLGLGSEIIPLQSLIIVDENRFSPDRFQDRPSDYFCWSRPYPGLEP